MRAAGGARRSLRTCVARAARIRESHIRIAAARRDALCLETRAHRALPQRLADRVQRVRHAAAVGEHDDRGACAISSKPFRSNQQLSAW